MMRNTIKLKTNVIITCIVGLCGLASCAEQSAVSQRGDLNSVDNILSGLQNAAGNLKSYQCKVEYLFSQPVLESKTLRTGNLFYAGFKGSSKLKIDFNTLTQEDGPRQKYIECYIFDGQWLTHIDYQIKQVQKRQLAEANEPIDAFELAKRNFPVIGFSKTEDLNNQFDVNLVIDSNNQIHLIGPATARSLYSDINDIGASAVTSEPNQIIHLHLKVRPESEYKDEYKTVDVWLDKELMLPGRLTAVSTQGDIYEIKFIEPKVNKPIDEKVFEFTIPKDFGEPEIIPLKKTGGIKEG